MPSAIHSSATEPESGENWMDGLPAVSIKEQYLSNAHAPPATGDSASRTWPYDCDVVTLSDFHDSFEKYPDIFHWQRDRLVLGAGRALAFLDVGGAAIDSIDVLLALYTSGQLPHDAHR